MEEGIVPGGGVALLRAQSALEGLGNGPDEKHGVAIVRRALEEPLRQIAVNAGYEGSVVVEKTKNLAGSNGSYGFDAATEEYGDLMAQGIVDPVKVTRSALQNAASIAGMVLLHAGETLIVEKPQKKALAGGGGYDDHMDY